MAVDIRGMACAYLRAGAVDPAGGVGGGRQHPRLADRRPVVRAQVIGNSGVCSHSHMQTRTGGDVDAAMSVCAHASAVQLVTGHPSRARKEPKR